MGRQPHQVDCDRRVDERQGTLGGGHCEDIPKVTPLRAHSQAILDINTFMSSREASPTRQPWGKDITHSAATLHSQYSVLIISYETFRIHAKLFHSRPDSCDLLICDEAHRCVDGLRLNNISG